MVAEDFVTFEQAVKLKELGFNEPCSYYYNSNQQLSYAKECALSPGTTNNCCSDEIADGIATAPILAEATKWLRERHLLCVEVWYYNPCHAFRAKVNLMAHLSDKFCYKDPYPFPTYETALSAGVDAAIDLLAVLQCKFPDKFKS